MATHCRKCHNEAGSSIPGSTLPCGHFFCLECINSHASRHRRNYCLPCPDQRCGSQPFSVVQPRDPRSNSRVLPFTLLPLFVRDWYAANVGQYRTMKERGKPKIMGLTVLDNYLFVVDEKVTWKKYSIPNDSANGQLVETGEIEKLTWPRGIASSLAQNSLYIIDWSKLFGGTLWVYRLVNSITTSVQLGVQPFGVATFDFNNTDITNGRNTTEIYVTCSTPVTGGDQQIIVFRDDGQNVTQCRSLRLPSSFQIPRHSIPLRGRLQRHPLAADAGDEVFAVCHGWTAASNNCVSLVKVTRSNTLEEINAYGSKGGSDEQQLRRPLSLCVDDSGMLLVTDYHNDRIQLLTQDMQLVRHVVTSTNGIKMPRQICLSHDLLFIGSEDGSIGYFKVRE